LKEVSANTNFAKSQPTIAPSSGKWYAEYYVNATQSNGSSVGAATLPAIVDGSNQSGNQTGETNWCINQSNTAYQNIRIDGTTQVDSLGNVSAGDVLGLALDADNGKITFYRNNSVVGSSSGYNVTNTGTDVYFFQFISRGAAANTGNGVLNFGQDSSFAGQKTAQGNQDSNSIGDFYYEPPSGFLALCTDNLAAPEIADPTDHFNTALYTGNDTTNAITGVGFQPDWLWVKNRTTSGDYPVMVDAVRGETEVVSPASNSAEWTDSTAVTSFDSDGFTLGNATTDWNRSGGSFVAWNWKGDGVSGGTLNEDGTIDSQVNVNTTAGFSVLTYTGTGSNATVGHGLAQTPELFFVKRRDGAGWSWYGYNEPAGNTKSVYLNSTTIDTDSTFWNDSSPTASVINVGTANGINQDTGTYLAYCFHSVEGYSKIGSYTGNGDNDGPFVYTGFRPAYILIRRYDSGNSWIIQDDARSPYNTVKAWLNADDTAVEYTGWTGLDMNSNGFKPRDGSANTMNASGGDYLYMAFASTPFKTSNAR
jgi:hypothetical protein